MEKKRVLFELSEEHVRLLAGISQHYRRPQVEQLRLWIEQEAASLGLRLPGESVSEHQLRMFGKEQQDG